MCTVEQTKAINNAMELRLIRRMDAMQKMYEDKVYSSHNGVAKTISNSMDIHTKNVEKIAARVEEVNNTNKEEHALIFEHMRDAKPLVDFKNGIVSIRSIIIGLATVGVAVATVWGGFTWIINKAVH